MILRPINIWKNEQLLSHSLLKYNTRKKNIKTKQNDNMRTFIILAVLAVAVVAVLGQGSGGSSGGGSTPTDPKQTCEQAMKYCQQGAEQAGKVPNVGDQAKICQQDYEYCMKGASGSIPSQGGSGSQG